MKIDELDSTGEILAAHDAIEHQMNMLSQISSPSGGSRLLPSHEGNPQKQILQAMMMQLKDRYTKLKERKEQQQNQVLGVEEEDEIVCSVEINDHEAGQE